MGISHPLHRHDLRRVAGAAPGGGGHPGLRGGRPAPQKDAPEPYGADGVQRGGLGGDRGRGRPCGGGAGQWGERPAAGCWLRPALPARRAGGVADGVLRKERGGHAGVYDTLKGRRAAGL